MEIKFNCGNCGRRLSAETEMGGERLPCPDCGGEVVVPEEEVSQQSTVGSGQYRAGGNGEEIHGLRPPRGGRGEKSSILNNQFSTFDDGKKGGGEPKGAARFRGGPGGMLVIAALFLIVGVGVYFLTRSGKGSGGADVGAVGVQLETDAEKAGNGMSNLGGEEVDAGVGADSTSEAALPEADEIDAALSGVDIKVVEEKSVESANGAKWKVEYGDFDIKAGLYRNEVVKVHYSMPLGADGKALESASNVVFICPYLPERSFYKHDYHRWWSEVAGYASFSFDITTELREIYDRKKCYYYPESGFHDLAFKVKEILEKRYGLESRNILLAGQSSGSIMAKEFVLKTPFRVDAAAYSGGHNNIYLYNPKFKDARTACLVMHTVGDHYQKADESFPFFIQALRTICPPIWKNKGGRFFHHTASPTTWNLIHLFVKGVVDLRAAHGGKVPKFREWPYSIERDWGRNRTLYFPSKEFMDAWKALPNEILTRLREDPALSERESVCLIPEKPKSVVVYIGDPAEDGKKKSVSMIDTLYYLYLRGHAACGLRITKDKKSSYKRIVKLLKQVRLNADWKNIPKYVVGLGPGGRLAAAAALRHGERMETFKDKIKKGRVTFFKKRVVRTPFFAGITVVNVKWAKRKPGAVLKKLRGKSELPLTLIYSADFAGSILKRVDKRTKIVKLKVNGHTLGKKWFETIGEAVESGR